jgi:lipopolysaccharide biosynthesis regulator YciM
MSAFDSQVALARGSKVAQQEIDVLAQIVSKLARAYRRAGSQVKLQNLFTRARPLLGDNNPTLDVITIEGLREDGKRREAPRPYANRGQAFSSRSLAAID